MAPNRKPKASSTSSSKSRQTSAPPRYVEKKDHRNGSPLKSQWIITFAQEESAFRYSLLTGWCLGSTGWGLYIRSERPEYLGLGAKAKNRGHEQLFIARFDQGNPSLWHGCPADPQIHNHDVPPDEVLQNWVDRRLLTVPQQRRIMRSQPCSLSKI